MKGFKTTMGQSCNNTPFENAPTRKGPAIVVNYNNEGAPTRKRPAIVVNYNNESAHTRKRPAIVVNYNNESLSLNLECLGNNIHVFVDCAVV
jgi:hypothetical protein